MTLFCPFLWRWLRSMAARRARVRIVAVAAMLLGACDGHERTGEACTDCTLTVDTVVIIGESDSGQAGAVFSEPVQIVSDGKIILALNFERDRLIQFAPDGGIIRLWGHPGDGPGELRNIEELAIQDDGSVVVRRLDLRLVRFDSLGRVLGEGRTRLGCELTRSGSRTICLERLKRGTSTTPRIRILALAGDDVMTLTPQLTSENDPDCPMCQSLTDATMPSGSDGVWVASRHGNRVQLWMRDGVIPVNIDLTPYITSTLRQAIPDSVEVRVVAIGLVVIDADHVIVIHSMTDRSKLPSKPFLVSRNGVAVQSPELTQLRNARPLGTSLAFISRDRGVERFLYNTGRVFRVAGNGLVYEVQEARGGRRYVQLLRLSLDRAIGSKPQ